MVKHVQKVAIVCENELLAMSVSWEPPISPNDSGFCLFFSESTRTTTSSGKPAPMRALPA